MGGGDPLARRLAIPAVLQTLLDPNSPLGPFMRAGALADRMAQAFAGSLDQTARAIRAGVPILAGSDAGNPVTFHGVSLIRELELLAQAGMPLGDVLKSATSRPADRFGQSSLGRIAAGAIADIVILEDDPTERVAAYRRVVSVYLGGRKLDPAASRRHRPAPGVRVYAEAGMEPTPRQRIRELGWEPYAWLIYSLPFLFASFDRAPLRPRNGRHAGGVRRVPDAVRRRPPGSRLARGA